MFSSPALTFGPFEISESLLTSLGITLLLVGLSIMLTRRLLTHPGKLQVMLEGIVESIEDAIGAVQPDYAARLTPLIGTLWIFLVIANLVGIIPGLESPTKDLSVTSALAIIVFFSVHWFGIRSQGLIQYLRHYLSPTPFLLPFHVISEFTRTLALAVRLFGNIMSLEIAALLVLMVAGFLAPIPLLMLHIVEALVQAYIFGILALIYIASALQTHQAQADKMKKAKGVQHE
ncbi:F0F1 ATP synthase subunit A [Photobacterium galatheae]|nr:F0F1 ATP synthase subunit A [Photobacterium galatheae]